MNSRILHLLLDTKRKCLWASSIEGELQQYDLNLKLIKKSKSAQCMAPYVLVQDENCIYARDIQGQVLQWCADTLELKKILSLNDHFDPELAPIPTVSHGLKIINNEIILAGADGNVYRIELDTLKVISKLKNAPDGFFEDIEGTQKNTLAVDCVGKLYKFNVENGGFEFLLRVDHGATHRIVYDRIHDRHWITADSHVGICLYSKKDSSIQRIPITRDDVEWIAFNEDQSLAYVACFDHYLHVLRNEKIPKVIQKIGPFKFQLKQVEYFDSEHIYVLLESGEIYRCNSHGKIISESGTGTDCIWDLKRFIDDECHYWAAHENGFVEKLKYDGEKFLSVWRSDDLCFGRIRRVAPMSKDHLAIATSSGTVCVLENGSPVWEKKLGSIIRDIAYSKEYKSLIAVTENGIVTKINSETGATLWENHFKNPIWALCLTKNNEVFIGERICNDGDLHSTSNLSCAYLHELQHSDGTLLRSKVFCGNIKRIKEEDNNTLSLCGNGDLSAQLIRKSDFSKITTWDEWQLNTCEDVLIDKELVHTITYGYQLNTYKHDGTILRSELPFSNYPKVMLRLDSQRVAIAGRGPYIEILELSDSMSAEQMRENEIENQAS